MINIRAKKIMREKWEWENCIKLRSNIQTSLNSNKYCNSGFLQCQNFQIWPLEFELVEYTGWLHFIRTSSPCFTVLKAELGVWQTDKKLLYQPLVIFNSKITSNEKALYGFHFHEHAWFVLKPTCTLQHSPGPGEWGFTG